MSLMVLESNSNVYSSRYNKTTIPTTSLLGNLGKNLDLRQHPRKREAHHSYTRLLRCSVIMRAPGHILSNNNVKNLSSHTLFLKGLLLSPWKGTSRKKQEHQNHPLHQISLTQTPKLFCRRHFK